MSEGEDNAVVLIESPIPEASHLSRAECAVCRRSMPITRCGLVRVHGPVASRCPGSRNPPFSTSTPEAALALSLPRLSAKTVKRIPRASRDRSARKLANILDQVTSGGSEGAWNRLFCFAPRCL